jgi:hypothetical protein
MMNTKWMISAMVVPFGLLTAGAAHAQTAGPTSPPTITTTTAAPTSSTPDDYYLYQSSPRGDRLPPLTQRATTKAIELTIAPGYNQGFGHVASGQALLNDLGTAGGALEGGVAYRFNPRFALGVYGSGARFGRGSAVNNDAQVWSATAGLRADFHIAPALAFDPWVSVGTGWRGYWVSSDQLGGTFDKQGLQAGKLQVGFDFRMSNQVAISPMVGADLNVFLSEAGSGISRSSVSGPNVNTFLFAGVMGRFDIPVASASSRRYTARR